MSERNIAAEALSICMQTGFYGGRNIPVLLSAVPGCGKTSVVKQMAARIAENLKTLGVTDKFAVETFVLPQTMPETIEGVPSPDLERGALERLPLIGIRNLVDAQYGVAFLDEITSSSQQTGAACMTLIQDGVAGDTYLPPTIARVAACNPSWCAAAGREFTAPEINRMVLIEWELTATDFIDYLRGGPGAVSHIRMLSPDWEQRGTSRARTLVAAYLDRNRMDINTMATKVTDKRSASKPWASQRAWENVQRLLAAVFSLGEEPTSDLAYVLIKGMVGEGIAEKFIGWLREQDLPDPEDILKVAMQSFKDREEHLKNVSDAIPESVRQRPDKLRLCLESVAIAAQEKTHADAVRVARWNAAWYVLETTLVSKPDNALTAARILALPMPKGAKLPDCAVSLFELINRTGISSAGM